jgi:hypothetical protein
MRAYSTTFSWSDRGGPRYPARQRHRLVERRFVATCGPARQLGQQAKAAAQTLCGDPSRPGVVIADGAKWIKQEQAQHFPQASCILDWAHLWREISAAIGVAARAKLLGDARTRLPIAPAPILAVAGRGGSSGAGMACLGNGPVRRAAGDHPESDHLVLRTNAPGLGHMSTGASLAIPWAAA